MNNQSHLVPDTSTSGRVLEFDFPGLEIGVAQYAEGPTGATVFRFVDKAVGAVDVRGGRLCFGNQTIPTGESGIRELVELVPANVKTVDGSILGERRSAVPPSAQNTTISLVVTNRKLEYAELQRLATQVHTSMGRAIQPFGTLNDGDVLFAASTGEVDASDLHPTDLGTVASEVMWDAILASVPDIPDATAVASGLWSATDPTEVIGHYGFGNDLSMAVGVAEGGVTLTNTGSRDIFGVPPGASLAATPDGGPLFTTQSLFLPAFGFAGTGARRRLVLNPGRWQQVGTATR